LKVNVNILVLFTETVAVKQRIIKSWVIEGTRKLSKSSVADIIMLILATDRCLKSANEIIQGILRSEGVEMNAQNF